ncbi:MAG: Gfo/Idh/MocA family oxidoreductase [bacterium]|jgi:predicted dehydrogenase|nr:Gfo/Idh/MocA family oxidoreductase [bacterium]
MNSSMLLLSRRQFNQFSAAALMGLSFPGSFLKNVQSDKIIIAQIGTAHSHAPEKMETIRRLSDIFEVVGVAEKDEELIEKAQNQASYQDLTWLTEEQLLNMPGLKAVLVETEIDDLVPTALRCLEKGLHVHVDKPPGKSLQALVQLFSEAKKKRLAVQMGYMFRYHPAFQFCLNAVRDGWLGQLFEIDGVISKAINPKRRSDLAKTYGGGMMLLGCHLIDMVIALCGKPEKIHSYRRQNFSKKDELFDNDLAIFEYQDTIATIRSSLIEVDGEERRQFIVCGTKGTIEIKPLEPPQLRMTLSEAVSNFQKGWQTVKLPAMPGRYDEQLIDFARMIQSGTQNEFSIEHERTVQEALLKACQIFE